MKKMIWTLAFGAAVCATAASAGYFIPDSQAFDFTGRMKTKKTAVKAAEPSTASVIQKMFAHLFTLPQQRVVVAPQDEDFVVTLPTDSGLGITEEDDQADDAIPFLLEKADDFFGMTQYRMTLTDINQIQPFIFPSLLKTPVLVEAAQAEVHWIPKFNIFSQKSIALQQATLNMSGPSKMDAGQASLESTTIVSNNACDTVSVYELIGVSLTSGWGGIAAQQANGKTSLLRVPTTGQWTDRLDQIQLQSNFSLKNVALTLLGDKTPALTGHFSVRVNKEKTLDIGLDMTKIVVGPMGTLLFPQTPKTISAQISVSGLNPILKIIGEYAAQAEKNPNQAPVLKQIALDKINGMWSDVKIDIKQISASNDATGLTVSGWLIPPKSGITTLPESELKLQAMNLDILSPEPKVNKAACNYARTTVRKNATPTELAKIQKACQPQGGVLDALRPYLNKKARVKGPAGQTIDTFSIAIKNDKIQINGKDATADFMPGKN